MWSWIVHGNIFYVGLAFALCGLIYGIPFIWVVSATGKVRWPLLLSILIEALLIKMYADLLVQQFGPFGEMETALFVRFYLTSLFATGGYVCSIAIMLIIDFFGLQVDMPREKSSLGPRIYRGQDGRLIDRETWLKGENGPNYRELDDF